MEKEGIKDLSNADFKILMHQAVDMIIDLYDNIHTKNVFQSKKRDEVYNLFKGSLPEKSTAIKSLLETIEEDVIPNTALHFSPHFYAWVTSNATQASILGDMLASALNVNATTWLNAPASSELEQRVIRWIIEFIDFDSSSDGILLSGGSLSNFTGIRVAINQKCPYNYLHSGFDRLRPIRIYTSEQSHFCIDRAVASLGIGTENLVKVKVGVDYKMNLDDLVNKIEKDISSGFIPIAVIANAGTVNSGAIDPIKDLSVICKKYNLWLHVDAAYGGFAASVTELRNREFKGLELADSLTIDLHKWLFVPFECGALLVKSHGHLKDTFSLIPAYQKFQLDENKVDFSEYSMQQSRNFKALKVWMNFKAYGSEKLKQSISHSIELMNYLGGLIRSSEDFELMAPVSLSVICFRYVPPKKLLDTNSLNSLNQDIINDSERDGRVFIRETTLNGNIIIRACCTNFRREKENIKYLIEVLRELGIRNAHKYCR